MTIKHVSAAAVAAICFASAMARSAACADDYPSRPITMVVPLAPQSGARERELVQSLALTALRALGLADPRARGLVVQTKVTAD